MSLEQTLICTNVFTAIGGFACGIGCRVCWYLVCVPGTPHPIKVQFLPPCPPCPPIGSQYSGCCGVITSQPTRVDSAIEMSVRNPDLFSSMECGGGWVLLPLFFLGGFVFSSMIHKMTWVGGGGKRLRSLIKSTGSRRPFFFFKSLLLRVFFLLFFLNIFGLSPYNQRVTSHGTFLLVLRLGLCFSLWLSSLSGGVFKFFSGFTPGGIPLPIRGFLRIVEGISTFIRPLTLSLRLSIKISTGHIFLAVLGRGFLLCFFSSRVGTPLVLLLLTGYFFFELFVSFIQSYVYLLLLRLYGGE